VPRKIKGGQKKIMINVFKLIRTLGKEEKRKGGEAHRHIREKGGGPNHQQNPFFCPQKKKKRGKGEKNCPQNFHRLSTGWEKKEKRGKKLEDRTTQSWDNRQH